jgi:exosortase
MHAVEESEPALPGFGQEIQFYWSKLPDKVIFAGLLAAWYLLFRYFGWVSAIAGQTGSLFDWMWGKWTDPANDASHGKLIPWVVLGLLWLRRKQLIKSVSGSWWPGLAGLAVCLGLHVVGFLVQQPRLSMVALFGGAWILVGLVWGAETLKAAFFPFFIFAFCVPMGGTFAQGLTLPLRLFAAKGVYFIANNLLDVPVLREGTRLVDPTGAYGSFEVAAECSGIRSFTALLAITTIFSVLTMKPLWKKAVMLLSTIPLALFCNIIRVTAVILASNAYKTAAAGRVVDKYFGYVTYALAIGGMLLLARLLRDKAPTPSPP